MNIQDIIDSGASVTFAVKPADLAAFAQDIAEQTRREITIAEELYKVPTVMRIFKVTHVTLHRWNKSGYLTHVEIGGSRRYRKSDIREVLKIRKK